MRVHIDYQPTAKQRIFHLTDADEVLYGGAAGGGKSKAIVMDALARTLRSPGTHAWIFRRTYPELEDSIITEAKRSYPQEIAKYNAARHEMLLPNGSKIHFRHCAQPADALNYKGSEMQFLYFDELTSFEESIYDFICSRKRAQKELGVKPIVRSASNPGGIGHGWVKNRFVDAGRYMEKIRREIFSETLGKSQIVTTQYIPALATDNPYITNDYVFELERKPEALRKALLLGHWDAFEGQVFVEWRDDSQHYRDRRFTHVIEPFDIPSEWPRYMSFDFGYSKPFSCGWWAVGPDGCAYRYREWYGWDGHANMGAKLSTREIAEGIVARETTEAKEGLRVLRVADPAIFDASRGESIASAMEPFNSMTGKKSVGVFFERGENSRLAGLAQMHERLRFDETGRPKLQVFNTCRHFIRTIPTLPYDPNHAEDIDTRAEDHVFDESRYFLMMQPMPAVTTKRTRPRDFSPFYNEGN